MFCISKSCFDAETIDFKTGDNFLTRTKERVAGKIEHSFVVERGAIRLSKSVFKIINEVHGVEGTANYKFIRKPITNEGYHKPGEYIIVSTNAAYPLLTGVHEIGHSLDDLFLNSLHGFGTLDNPYRFSASELAFLGDDDLLQDWFQAVKGTEKYQTLLDVRRKSNTVEQFDLLAYFTSAVEIWARSYEQFIATNCQNREIKVEFQRQKRDQLQTFSGGVRLYWTNKDFVPINRAMKMLFRSIGWMS